MRKSILFFAIVFLFLLNFVSAADDNCIISSDKSDAFAMVFDVNENGSSIMRVDLKILFSQDCIIKNFPLLMQVTTAPCRKEMISDSLFRTMDIFILRTECFASYSKSNSQLWIRTVSVTEKIVKENGDYSEIRFDKWVVAPEKPGAKNTFEINLPEGSRIVSFFPQKNSTASSTSVFWSIVPEEPVSIQFLKKGKADNFLPMLLLGIAGIIIVVFFVKWFFSQKKNNERMAEIEAEEKAMAKELKELEISYLKRKLDEQTYKKLIVEIEIRINKLQIEKKTILEKRNVKQAS